MSDRPPDPPEPAARELVADVATSRPRLGLWLALSSLLAAFTALPAGIATAATAVESLTGVMKALGVVGGIGLAALPVALLVMAVRAGTMTFGSRYPDQISVDGEGITVERKGKTRKYLHRRFSSGVARPSGAVDLATKSGQLLRVQLRTRQDVDWLLRATRLDATQRSYTMRFRRLFYQLLIGMLVIPGLLTYGALGMHAVAQAMVPQLAAWSVPLGLVLGAFGSYLALRGASTDVTVGADGIVVRRWRKRFIPYSELREVREMGSAIEIVRQNGARQVLWANCDDPAERTALVERIHDAMRAAARSEDDAAAKLRLLRQDGRDVPAWRKQLAKLTEHADGYRNITLSREELRDVLADDASKLEDRVAAAVALADDPEPATRLRVGEIAKSVAQPRLRISLEQISQGEASEQVLEQALEHATEPLAAARN
jgi:hypothetical protein